MDAAISQAPAPMPSAPPMPAAHGLAALCLHLSAGRRGLLKASGNEALIAIGGATGARYYFAGRGYRVRIDPRDRDLLAMMDVLVEVQDAAEPAL